MAFKKLAITTTLDQMQANIRSNSGTLSQQESQIIATQLDNICHDSILKVYSLTRPFIWKFYETDATSADGDIAEASNLIDISALDIADIENMTLFDVTHGEVPILGTKHFQVRRKQDSAITNRLFARVTNVKATDNKLQIQTERGSSVATPGALVLTYNRSPKKTVNTDTDRKLDLPERYIPLATDLATLAVFKRVGKEAPGEVTGSIQRQLEVLAVEIKGLDRMG